MHCLQVDFETSLDLAPYMSDRRSPPVPYQLYAVLVHQGHSVHSGHYYAFVRAGRGQWHQMNDNQVCTVPLPSALVDFRAARLLPSCPYAHSPQRIPMPRNAILAKRFLHQPSRSQGIEH